jgi:hypothetical protein
MDARLEDVLPTTVTVPPNISEVVTLEGFLLPKNALLCAQRWGECALALADRVDHS